MILNNSYIFIKSLIIFLCVGCVQNKGKLKRNHNMVSDRNLNTIDFIRKFNYPSETHRVMTEDGYFVNLFRIPNNGPPVLLVHGIADSSDSWLILGPADSLGYLLSDAGFDVWLYNARGNKYSKGHARNITQKNFWNFSYEEMGTHDLPATIDYILQTTSRPKLSYVGFSQGTTILLVMCSMRPQYNEKILHAILLAPVAWVSHLKFPFIGILSQNVQTLSSLVEKIGLYEWYPNNPILNLYHYTVCNRTHPAKVLCDIEYYINFGLRNITNLSVEKLPVIASHITSGTSAKTFMHFIQGYASKRFQRYNNYGLYNNNFIYGSPEPPEYDLSSVKVPLTLFVSESDWFSNILDVQTLINVLPTVNKYVVFNKSLDFTHLEFAYGARVKKLVNEPVITLLQEYNKHL